MKFIFIIFTIFILSPVYSFADCIDLGQQYLIGFPGKDLDEDTPFSSHVFKDHLTIMGAKGLDSCLPLQYPDPNDQNPELVTGPFTRCGIGVGPCFTITGSTMDPISTAVRNSWVAALLKGSTTGEEVTVRWAVPDIEGSEEALAASLGNCWGCIVEVSFK